MKTEINKVSFETGRDYSIARTAWSDKIDAYIYAEIDAVKAHVNYNAAKAGSFEDSVLLAQAFMYEKSISKLKSMPENTIILPIMAEEKMGKNAILLGMADVIK